MDRKSVVTISLLLAITLAAFAIRFFLVGESPTSLNWDEAAQGYNAYSMLHTGKDEYGKTLPISLRSFDDYKPALYTYLAIPAIRLGGLNDVTTRLPSVIAGSLLPLILFAICYPLTKSRAISFLAAILVAFEPWAMHFSRVAFESNVAMWLYFVALALFVRSLKNFKYYTWSVAFFVLSMYGYHSERAIALPTLVALTILFRQQLSINIKTHWRSLLFIAGVLLAPLIVNSFTQPITARLSYTNVFKLWPFIPEDFSAAIYNPVYSFLWHATGQFMAYFSPYTLFVTGSLEPGQYTPTLGLLHLVELPFWFAGLLLVKNYQRLTKFILPILVLAPLPAVITWNWFSAVRTLPLYPLFAIITAIGIAHAKKIIIPVVAVLWMISVGYLINTEIIYAPAIVYGEYQPGFEKSIPILLAEAKNYDHVVIDSPHIAPYIFLLFYGQYDPALYLSQKPYREKNSGTESIPFSKFEFREITWLEDRNLPHTLFIGPTVRLPDYEFENTKTARIITDVYDIKGYVSLRIVATE